MKKNNQIKKLSYLVLALVILFFSLNTFSGCKTNSFINIYSKNVNEYIIKADINTEEKTVNIVQKTIFVNQTKNVALKNVYFHLYQKAFSEGVVNKPVSTLNEKKAYPNGINYGEIDVVNVKLCDEEITPRYLNADKDILVVDLNNELLPNKTVEIYFEYNLKLPNINHRYGYGENTINLGNFYIIACVYDENLGWFANSYNYNGDPFYSEMANYDVTITCNKDYVLASSGDLMKETEENNMKTYNIKAKAIRDFALILSYKYEIKKGEVNGIKINYFYYNDKSPETSLQTIVDSLTTFEKLFGKYPYNQLSVCESNFVYGGMEYPNIVFISDNLDIYEDYTYTIIHEIAHQWWYGLVGNNEFKYGFLDESLAEYSVYIFFDENPKYNMDTEEMIKNTTNSYMLFLDVYKEVFSKIDTSMLRSLDEYNTEPEYIYMAYVKGTLMYDNLKHIIGKNNFIKSLKYYFKENCGKNALPSDLISAFNKVCKKDLEPYFNSWLNGTVVIESL